MVVAQACSNGCPPSVFPPLTVDIVKFIQDSKENLVSVMRRQFSIYFNPYVHIFDEFYEYLESSVWTGDVCQLKERFTKV